MAKDVVVGFIGLGTMGGKMATNILKAGFKVVVHDLHRQSASHHLQAGAEWADTPRALAEKSDVIFTSLPEPADVERVSLGADGLIEGVKKGAAYFDLSTNSQSVVKKIHEAFAAKGAQMLDAPVSGGPSGAESRKMAIWVGGDKAAFEQYKPVLDAMGDRPAYIGPIGSATVAKLVHNMSSYAITCALAETFSMGVKAGMDPVALWEAVRQGVTGRRLTFDGLLEQFLPGKYDPPNFALKLATKDVALATALGRELGVPMRICNLRHAEMTEACNRGWEGRDSRSVMLLQQERAGVKIAADPERVKQAAERAKADRAWERQDARVRTVRVALRHPRRAARRRILSAAIRMTGRCRWIISCGSPEAAGGRLSSIPDSMPRCRRGASAPSCACPVEGAGGARHRCQCGRGRHPHPSALRPCRQFRPLSEGAVSSAGAANSTYATGTLHALSAAGAFVRGRGYLRHRSTELRASRGVL